MKMTKRALRREALLWLAVFAIGVLGVILAGAQMVMAQDVGTDPAPAPWDDVVVTFGAVTLGWAAVQMGVINILKGIQIQGKPLLDTAGKIWLANAALGVLGLTLAATQAGTPFLAAVIQAALVIFGSAGIYESPMVKRAGKVDGTSNGEQAVPPS